MSNIIHNEKEFEIFLSYAKRALLGFRKGTDLMNLVLKEDTVLYKELLDRARIDFEADGMDVEQNYQNLIYLKEQVEKNVKTIRGRDEKRKD